MKNITKKMQQKGMVVRGGGLNIGHYAQEKRNKGYAILWTSFGFSYWK